MTVCVDDRAPSGAPGLPKKADGSVWNYNTQYAGLEDCETVISLGMHGASFAEMCKALGVGKPTVKRWMENFPEFGDAMEYAKVLSESWWRVQGQAHLVLELNDKGKPSVLFSTTIWKTTLEHEYGAIDADARDKIDSNEALIELGKGKLAEIRAREADRLALNKE